MRRGQKSDNVGVPLFSPIFCWRTGPAPRPLPWMSVSHGGETNRGVVDSIRLSRQDPVTTFPAGWSLGCR